MKKFIYASSAGVYGNGDEPFKEDRHIHFEKSLGFYIGSKYCSEVILDNYAGLLDVIQMRFIFVYGKGQDRGMLIPRLVDNIRSGIPIILQGEEGFATNPVHVSDAVNAIEAALQINGSEKFNIGGNEVLSLKKITQIIGEQVAVSPAYTIQTNTARNIIGDITRMKDMLTVPRVNFASGIKDLL